MYTLSGRGIAGLSRVYPAPRLDSLPAEMTEQVAACLRPHDLGALRLSNSGLYKRLSAMHRATRLLAHSAYLCRAAALARPTPPKEFDALLQSVGKDMRHVYRAGILANLARALPGLPPDLRPLAPEPQAMPRRLARHCNLRRRHSRNPCVQRLGCIMRQVQSQLGAAPQDVFRGSGPFMSHQIA